MCLLRLWLWDVIIKFYTHIYILSEVKFSWGAQSRTLCWSLISSNISELVRFYMGWAFLQSLPVGGCLLCSCSRNLNSPMVTWRSQSFLSYLDDRNQFGKRLWEDWLQQEWDHHELETRKIIWVLILGVIEFAWNKFLVSQGFHFMP